MIKTQRCTKQTCILPYQICYHTIKRNMKVSSAKYGLNCMLQVITLKLLQIIKITLVG